MPLTSGGENGWPYEAGVAFGMLDGDRQVIVRVSHEALRDKTGRKLAGDEYMEAFQEHRSAIERVASRRFDAGQIDADGAVLG